MSGKELYRRNVPADLPEALYGNTSYVVQGHDSFYQLCNGTGGGIMLNFNIYKKSWEIVMNTDSWFNYLSIDRDGSIWVSGHDGLYNISPDLKEKQYIQTLKLVDGRKIDTEISTLYNDLQGGMWIGTLNRGILYYHPNRFRFQNIGKVMFSLPEETSMHVTGFEETENKDIIVKTDTGNYLYNPKSGSISVYKGKVTTIKEEKSTISIIKEYFRLPKSEKIYWQVLPETVGLYMINKTIKPISIRHVILATVFIRQEVEKFG